jgi:hypothetical protein
MASLHDHPTSRDEKPRSSTKDAKPRDEKKLGDIKARHRAERVAMFQAQRAESRDLFGNHAEEQRQMHNRHEKSISDLSEMHERERTGAPRWRDPPTRSSPAPRVAQTVQNRGYRQ